ncbi:hypothetical protein DPMN_142316 [Dreissena polymorpha]|uniref:Uncharacterized protein n=1 Tax=Dreissena polymorpha TaxID=45954 RepID=A0A9D4JIJ3_DREPO|nr:hypothetical protein DPMN_142316 [Dreissena polymorpha]
MLLHIKCGMVELGQQRIINQLKYCARTISMENKLPINLSVTLDPAYRKRKDNLGLLCAINVQALSKYYLIDEIKIQAPTYYRTLQTRH